MGQCQRSSHKRSHRHPDKILKEDRTGFQEENKVKRGEVVGFDNEIITKSSKIKYISSTSSISSTEKYQEMATNKHKEVPREGDKE